MRTVITSYSIHYTKLYDVRKYIQINEEQVKLSVDKQGDFEVLELNISLAEPGK